jgi:hypothetical protein
MSLRSSIRRTISSQSLRTPQRILKPTSSVRDDAFSVGDEEFHIEYVNVPSRMFWYDSFHSLIQFEFFPLLVLILSLILLLILFFAIVYLSISDECGLHLSNLSEAWLFALLVHFKTVLSSADPDAMFWHGCPSGIAGLFGQLFIGNILMSVLLSSLVFNFQSIARRNKSLFTTITMGQEIHIAASSKMDSFDMILPVVEMNESEIRKVTGVVASVFVFDPVRSRTISLATNVPLQVTVPTELRVEIPRSLYSETPTTEISVECKVCGKECTDQSSLILHANSLRDQEHEEFSQEVIGWSQNDEKVNVSEVASRLRRDELEFIVIVEGSDPVTNDRIQVQKIYRNFSTKPLPVLIEKNEQGLPAINYEIYL